MRGLSKDLVLKLFQEHIGHCVAAHGEPVLSPTCEECLAFAERTMEMAHTTPDVMLADIESGKLDPQFALMAEALQRRRQQRGSAWD